MQPCLHALIGKYLVALSHAGGMTTTNVNHTRDQIELLSREFATMQRLRQWVRDQQ